MEEALLRLEVEIVELGDFEDVVDGMVVVIKVGTSGDSNVVHVDTDCGSKGFMFENGVPVDKVHHGLESCW